MKILIKKDNFMEKTLGLLVKELKELKDYEAQLSDTIKDIINNEDEDFELKKKAVKNLKKLEFYLEGGNDLIQDTIKSIEKSLAKKEQTEEFK
jgi:hypothetical protein